MDPAIIQRAGLTESQAKGYLALIEHGSLTPTKAAGIISETRTNTYAVLNKLVELGLATKDESGKTHYTANHPAALEALAERRRRAITKNEQLVKQNIAPLIDMFYATSEMPGTRTLQGVEGIKEVYRDVLAAKQPVYLLRSTADEPDLGVDFINTHREKRAKLGIDTYAITPDTAIGRQNYASGEDERLLFHRTFMSSYDSPVEIQIYGSKCAFIAYGETQMATIIDSPLIANTMRWLLKTIAASLAKESDHIKAEVDTSA